MNRRRKLYYYIKKYLIITNIRVFYFDFVLIATLYSLYMRALTLVSLIFFSNYFIAQVDTLFHSTFDLTEGSNEWSFSTSEDCPEVYWELTTFCGDFPTANSCLFSTTQDNGFAVLNSSEFQGPCDTLENAYLTLTEPLNFNNIDHIVVEFETYYRSFQADAGFLVTSTNNTDWPELYYSMDVSEMPNVYKIFGAGDALEDNPTIKTVNISESAGGEEEVWIRFVYTGWWGYFWFIDDFYVFEETENDIRITDTRISQNTDDISYQYAQIPESQLSNPVSFQAIGIVTGYQQQTDVQLNLTIQNQNSIIVYEDQFNFGTLEAYETYVHTFNVDLSSFSIGEYNVEFEVSSNEEVSDIFMEDNSKSQQFAITDDLYALDGIGVFDTPIIGEIGAGSYSIDNNPNFPHQNAQLMNKYAINDGLTVYGVRVLLGSNEPGISEIRPFIIDSAAVFSENLNNTISIGETIIVNSGDINIGFIDLEFDEPFYTENSNLYYGIDIINSPDFRIKNDLTISQNPNASVVFTDEIAETYITSNAFSIQLLLSPVIVSIEENIITDFEIFQNIPNPAVEKTTIFYSLSKESDITLEITDIQGKLILEKTNKNETNGNHSFEINTSNFISGIYSYKITCNGSSITKKMMIN